LGSPQFTANQVIRTLTIAKARVHVERAICRMKGYSILEFISPKLVPYASKIFQVCDALINFQFPLIKEVESFCLQPTQLNLIYEKEDNLLYKLPTISNLMFYLIYYHNAFE